jgi:hypothetical protein
MRRILIAVGLISIGSIAHAGQYDYKCTVKQVYDIDKGAAVLQDNKRAIHVAGQTFVVSRQTGDVIGQPYTLNRAQGWKEFSIVDPGSDQQSFKLLAKSGGFANVVYLTVKEYEKATSKTFAYYDNFTLVVGTCE